MGHGIGWMDGWTDGTEWIRSECATHYLQTPTSNTYPTSCRSLETPDTSLTPAHTLDLPIAITSLNRHAVTQRTDRPSSLFRKSPTAWPTSTHPASTTFEASVSSERTGRAHHHLAPCPRRRRQGPSSTLRSKIRSPRALRPERHPISSHHHAIQCHSLLLLLLLFAHSW